MAIQVALNHRTTYLYNRAVSLAPQVIRLRPVPHCHNRILSYSLKVHPQEHFENWQQDPQGNYIARYVFPEKTRSFEIEVDLITEISIINPFDFFVDETAEFYPFQYDTNLSKDLSPFRDVPAPGERLSRWLGSVDLSRRHTVELLVETNARLCRELSYLVRLELGVQTAEQTLELGSGSCRDYAWLLVQILRNLGFAARFVSGYLIQLVADQKPLEGPEGPDRDFTDLHAWVDVYLPGAGWIGLDPTSGLLASEGHLPLACTPEPASAAPISGGVEPCESEFHFQMSIQRIQEDPRVTKPYTDQQWQRIDSLGEQVDQQLLAQDVRLTMGGEPTFVSVDDMTGEEWTTEALGPNKKRLAAGLFQRLRASAGNGAMMHFGQGKWYPGEPLPRWALTCYWRTDGEPMVVDRKWLEGDTAEKGCDDHDAKQFLETLAERLGIEPSFVIAAQENIWRKLVDDNQLPPSVDLDDPQSPGRQKLETALATRQVDRAVGYVLPIQRQWWQANPKWVSWRWPLAREAIVLVGGDSPIGLRLPLDSLPKVAAHLRTEYPRDPTDPRDGLPPHPGTRHQKSIRAEADDRGGAEKTVDQQLDSSPVIRTAISLEARGGQLHVFFPPVPRLEDYCDLVCAVEDTARSLQKAVVVEGYLPPPDHRGTYLKVTPDPGVIEVNTNPVDSWKALVQQTTTLYEQARLCRLGTEKFDLDGRHTGTGGGNHIVLGGPTPLESPFLRRPDLLRSLVGFWNNHPSLSYLFSSSFVGPTSQAPRVDEGRRDALYELEIAFDRIPLPDESPAHLPPWLVDRVFRHLLVDLSGNTHRAEFCIDKLYSPDSTAGRLGLVELRAFEMPPHARMSLTQQLLLRALVAQFWKAPYSQKLVHWGTTLHDRFFLPHFILQDLSAVLQELGQAGFNLELEWFAPHFEFRFPSIGSVTYQGIEVELRQAIEPWYVLGEEPVGGAATRYVDSSVERLQVKIRGMTDQRYVVSCNGRRVPLHPTGTESEFVAGVRYRAWQPPNCLHPTIPVHSPLIFDVVDCWLGRSVGGCQYHVTHPAGRNYEDFPVNAFEAESRRASRFFRIGHSPGSVDLRTEQPNPRYPMTLDLRR